MSLYREFTGRAKRGVNAELRYALLGAGMGIEQGAEFQATDANAHVQQKTLWQQGTCPWTRMAMTDDATRRGSSTPCRSEDCVLDSRAHARNVALAGQFTYNRQEPRSMPPCPDYQKCRDQCLYVDAQGMREPPMFIGPCLIVWTTYRTGFAGGIRLFPR